jgi:hypothetical protein
MILGNRWSLWHDFKQSPALFYGFWNASRIWDSFQLSYPNLVKKNQRQSKLWQMVWPCIREFRLQRLLALLCGNLLHLWCIWLWLLMFQLASRDNLLVVTQSDAAWLWSSQQPISSSQKCKTLASPLDVTMLDGVTKAVSTLVAHN